MTACSEVRGESDAIAAGFAVGLAQPMTAEMLVAALVRASLEIEVMPLA